MNIERRTVLQAGGLAAVGVAVAACSSGSTDSAEPPASEAAGGATAAATGAAAAGAVAQVADIPVGGGLILADESIVLTQPSDGDIKAFTAVCTHQGCLVSEVVDNEIVCPCHGSKFSAEDGSVLQGPATEPLSSAGIVVDGGGVVLS